MKVSIGDLDYYYAPSKVNCFNPDVMKISSYHKQLGDTINFVTKEDDIRRPYDIYYIIKEKSETPNPPLDFLLNKKVRWGGEAYRVKVKWKMTPAMLGCRPDYLLYPELNTQLERAEQVRFFDNDGKRLPLTQDYTNAFQHKRLMLTDPALWHAATPDLMEVLTLLKGHKNLYFTKPIDLMRLVTNEELFQTFLELSIGAGSNLKWYIISGDEFDAALKGLIRIKTAFPNAKIGPLSLKYSPIPSKHWSETKTAQNEFNLLCSMITRCKENKIQLKVIGPKEYTETPYFFIFQMVSEGTNSKSYKRSWLAYLSARYVGYSQDRQQLYWCRPYEWHPVFRDLLRQTYQNKEFLLTEGGNKKENYITIPGSIGEKEFTYGL